MDKKFLLYGYALWLVLFCNAPDSCAIFKNFEEGAPFGNPFVVRLQCNTKMILKNEEECETLTAHRQNGEKVELAVTFKAGQDFILLQNRAIEKSEEKREDRTVFWVFFEGLKKHRDELPPRVQFLHIRTNSYTIKEFLLGQDFQVVRRRYAAGNRDALQPKTYTKKIADFDAPPKKYLKWVKSRRAFCQGRSTATIPES